MKNWIRNLTGFVLSTLLAVGLTGKAHAEADSNGLPSPSPILSEDHDISPSDIPEEGTDLELAAVSGNTSGNDSSNDNDNDDGGDDDNDGGDDDDDGGDDDDNGGDDDDNGDGDDDNGDDDDDNGDGGDDGDGNDGDGNDGNVDDDISLGAELTLSGLPATGGATETSFTLQNAPTLEMPRGGGSGLPMENGEYILENCNEAGQSIESDGEVFIFTSGFNHIHSISSAIQATIRGTGILLVDILNVPVPLNLLTVEPYTEGSTAVFLLEHDDLENTDYYSLINGSSIPGLLVDEYVVEGIDLRLPPTTTLLLSSSVTDGTETAGSLVITDGASLTTVDGSSIILCSTDQDVLDNATVTPTLTVSGTGTLDLEGSIQGKGTISFENGSGAETLTLENAEVYCDGLIHVNNLVNIGQSEVVLRSNAEIGDIQTDGYLTIYTNKCYMDYADDLAHTITGMIGGGGQLVLNSGIYNIASTASLESGTSVELGYPLVYDYGGILPSSLGPLVIQPTAAEASTTSENHSPSIPVVTYRVIETADRGESDVDTNSQARKLAFDSNYGSEPYSFDVAPFTALTESGSYVINLADLQAMVDTVRDENEIDNPYSVVEVMRKDGEGHLTSTFYLYFSYVDTDENGEEITVSQNDLVGTIPADDVYLLRITYLSVFGAPWGGGTVTHTSTSSTGSGILGGSGAGTARYGSSVASASVNLRVTVTPHDNGYLLRVFSRDREITDLNGRRIQVRMPFSLPQGWNDGTLFAVFKNGDDSLRAFQAEYDPHTGALTFDADVTGDFILVRLDYQGELYTPEFYETLKQLPEIQQFLKVRV